MSGVDEKGGDSMEWKRVGKKGNRDDIMIHKEREDRTSSEKRE